MHDYLRYSNWRCSRIFCGYKDGIKRSIDYKQRWLDANATLQRAIESGEVKQIVKKPPAYNSTPGAVLEMRRQQKARPHLPAGIHPNTNMGDGITAGELITWGFNERWEFEQSRLQYGYKPKDPLTGLTPAQKLQFIKRRKQYGC